MDLKLNMTVDLSVTDVQRIIEETIKAQMQGYMVKGVTFEAGLSHDYLDRAGQPVFKGAKVTMVPKRTEF